MTPPWNDNRREQWGFSTDVSLNDTSFRRGGSPRKQHIALYSIQNADWELMKGPLVIAYLLVPERRRRGGKTLPGQQCRAILSMIRAVWTTRTWPTRTIRCAPKAEHHECRKRKRRTRSTIGRASVGRTSFSRTLISKFSPRQL